MSEIQHAGARKLLNIIAQSGAHSGKLTYRSAAKAMGARDYMKYSRAVAQMCDLLDAAACLAGVPLLALVAIRADDGEVNPKAWTREYSAARTKIIERSLNHRFSQVDIQAIEQALSDLEGLGNRKAWAFVQRTYGDLLYRRLVGDYTDPLYSALDDVGTNDPARVLYAGYAYLRDPDVRAAVLRRACGCCEYCGEEGFLKPDGTRYLETHQVIALASDGADKLTNVIALCPNDHRKAHFSHDRDIIEHKMQLKLQALASATGSPTMAQVTQSS
jgi:hypothetical protein